MARAKGRRKKLLARIGRLINSPLSAVGELLRDALDAENGNPAAIEQEIEDKLRILPHSFDNRFLFDSGLIQAVVESWTSADLPLSKMVVPRHDKAWGHTSVIMPHGDGDKAHVVELILMPGLDDPLHIDLLDYPWLCHELGHLVLFETGGLFVDFFQPAFEAACERIRSNSPVGPRAGMTPEASLHEIWEPRPDQSSWAHEIAADVIAVWTCGPAYAAAFQDFLQTHPISDAILVGHPRCDLRGHALAYCFSQLSWPDLAKAITRDVNDRCTGPRWAPSARSYAYLFDTDLVRSTVDAAIRFCAESRLPRCTAERVKQLTDALRSKAVPDINTDLIVAASIMFDELGPDEYQRWEESTVQAAIFDLDLEPQFGLTPQPDFSLEK